MNHSTAEPRRGGREDLNQPGYEFAVQGLVVFLSSIERLNAADRDDLIEALMSVIEDPSDENKDAVKQTFEEILEQSLPRVASVDLRTEGTPSAWSNFVGQKLKDLRKEHGLTQAMLAKKAGLQQSHVSRIERSEVSPARKTIEKLANAIGVDIGVFDPSA